MLYMEEGEKEEIVMTKRLAMGEPASKQAIVDADGDPVMTKRHDQPVRLTPSVTRRRSSLLLKL